MFSFLFRDAFALLLVLSITLHAGAVAVFGWLGPDEYTPPRLIPLREGRYSIHLTAARINEQPEPMPVPVAEKPEVVTTKVKQPDALPPVAQPPKPPEPKKEEEKKPAEAPPVKKPMPAAKPKVEPKKERPMNLPIAPKESGSSSASEGADKLELPQVQQNPSPPYPPNLLAARVEGVVLLEFKIGVDGRVANVRVVEGSGHPAFDDSALTTAQRWTFIPAKRRGIPVPVVIQQPFRFYIPR